MQDFLIILKNKYISLFTEDDIVEYLMHNYINKNCSATTYNMNIFAIKYFFYINFNKEFNSKLLPHAKLTKKIPLIKSILSQDFFYVLKKKSFLIKYNYHKNIINKLLKGGKQWIKI